MNVVLIGARAMGKSTVAELLGAALGWPVRHTDALVEARAGRSIAQLVADEGWPAFRALERVVVGTVASEDGIVVDTGGGVVLDPANVADLSTSGTLVWLDAAPEVARARLLTDASARPSLSGAHPADEVAAIMAERAPLYRAAADLRIDTGDLEPAEIVRRILARVVVHGG